MLHPFLLIPPLVASTIQVERLPLAIVLERAGPVLVVRATHCAADHFEVLQTLRDEEASLQPGQDIEVAVEDPFAGFGPMQGLESDRESPLVFVYRNPGQDEPAPAERIVYLRRRGAAMRPCWAVPGAWDGLEAPLQVRAGLGIAILPLVQPRIVTLRELAPPPLLQQEGATTTPMLPRRNSLAEWRRACPAGLEIRTRCGEGWCADGIEDLASDRTPAPAGLRGGSRRSWTRLAGSSGCCCP